MNKLAIIIGIVLCVTLVQPSFGSFGMVNSDSGEACYVGMVSDPDPASDPVPEDGAINVERTITLSWTTTSSTPDDDISYNVFFGKTPDPENVEIVYPYTSYDPGLLEYNTQYYWRIDTYSNDGATTGFLWTFKTKDDTPPNKPFNPSPTNEETKVNTSILLSWEGSDPDDDPLRRHAQFRRPCGGCFGVFVSPGYHQPLYGALGGFCGSHVRHAGVAVPRRHCGDH